MNSSFTKKAIETRITLRAGSFDGKGNQKTIRGLGSDVTIDKAGLPDKNKCTVKIYNMLYADMEQLAALGPDSKEKHKNLITVCAGDDDNTDLPIAFAGEIDSITADFSSAPDIVTVIKASTGSYPSLMANKPMSVKGNAPVADVIGSLASQCGYSFRNEGVTTQLRNSVLNGSPLAQAYQAADEAGADLILDDNEMILLPRESRRQGLAVYLSPETGLLGYPSFTDKGIRLKAVYNPNFRFNGLLEVSSIVPRATGTWKINKITHTLTAYRASSGSWHTDLEGESFKDE